MNSTLRLVDARVADADALSAAGQRLFTQAYGPHSEPADLAVHVERYFGHDSVKAELQEPDVSYTMAFDDDAIAGFLKLRRGPSPEAIPATDAVEVQQLYVDAKRQRRGVGRALVDRAVSVVLEEGRAGLWLSVWQDADWATAFYETYGFRAVGTADFWLGRTRYIDFLMWIGVDELR
jgi:ribosomal protein S18 acetylase RimI-like enzyme